MATQADTVRLEAGTGISWENITFTFCSTISKLHPFCSWKIEALPQPLSVFPGWSKLPTPPRMVWKLQQRTPKPDSSAGLVPLMLIYIKSIWAKTSWLSIHHKNIYNPGREPSRVEEQSRISLFFLFYILFSITHCVEGDQSGGVSI